jgi:NADPH:quinone reductase-like Zn-dependent oxidoreductase
MKAAYIDRFGGPEVLQCGDLPDPSAAAGQVVVDVAEASVNGADWRVRAGQYGQATFPLVLGRDLSGSVAALGAGVGDRRARSRARRRLRREACDQRGDHRKKPDRLSHVDAAPLALTGLSAIISVDATNFSAARPSSSTAGPAGWRASPSGLPSGSAP